MSWNGHKNFQTWNVTLWIRNKDGFYDLAKKCASYQEFIHALINRGNTMTPDKVAWADMDLDYEALDQLIESIDA